jgi:hypothetical protein
MDRIEQHKRSILMAHRHGTPIPAIAAKHLLPFAAVRDAIARWCPPSSPQPTPAKEPEPIKASTSLVPPVGGGEYAPRAPKPERNAKIVEMRKAGMMPAEIWCTATCAGMTRNAVIGVLHRAGLCEEDGNNPRAISRRVRAQPRNGGAFSRKGKAKPKHARALRMTLEPMSGHVGDLLDDTTGCVWPFDDRSPWPRRENRSADYLRCNRPRESFRNARGELVVRPYCCSHWDRAHAVPPRRKRAGRA